MSAKQLRENVVKTPTGSTLEEKIQLVLAARGFFNQLTIQPVGDGQRGRDRPKLPRFLLVGLM